MGSSGRDVLVYLYIISYGGVPLPPIWRMIITVPTCVLTHGSGCGVLAGDYMGALGIEIMIKLDVAVLGSRAVLRSVFMVSQP